MTVLERPSLVILDRDGVINHDSDHYIKSKAEWLPIPGSLEAIAELTHQQIPVAIATNQRGITLGLYDLDDLNAMHEKMQGLLTPMGGEIVQLEYCTSGDNHHPDRKPNPGMLHKILTTQAIDPKTETVYFVGDKIADMEAGIRAGVTPILVTTGKGAREVEKLPQFSAKHNVPQPLCFESLEAFVSALLRPS